MNIRLGVIGDEASMRIVEEISHEYPDFSVSYFPFATVEETLMVMKAQEMAIDIWLLMEPCAYSYVKEQNSVKRPFFHIPYRGASLFKTLCEIFYNAGLNIGDISFDTVPAHDIKRGLEEMNIKHDKPVFANDSSVQIPAEDLFRYHYALWEKGRTKAAVTCIGQVQHLLQAVGVPVYRVLPVRLSVRSMFYNMLREFDLQLVKDAQIAVQVFEFDILTDDEKIYSTDDIYNKEIQLTQKLIAYAKRIQGSLKSVGQGKYFIFTTRGVLRALTDNFGSVPAIDEFRACEQKLAACGIGIGLSAYEAEFNAMTALQNAKRYDKGVWMVVFDDKSIQGPLGKAEQLTYSHFSEALQRISLATSISVATLSKITGVMDKKRTNTLSAQDLAQYLHILPRSARRIMTRLEECGIAVATGEENPHPRGRPRKLYRIELGQG